MQIKQYKVQKFRYKFTRILGGWIAAHCCLLWWRRKARLQKPIEMQKKQIKIVTMYVSKIILKLVN